MSHNDRPSEAAGAVVPVPSTSLHLRGPAHVRRPINPPQQGVTPQFVLHVLRNWWTIAVPTGLLVAGIALGIVWWVFEPEYEATAWLRIMHQRPYIAFAPPESERGGAERFVQTQFEMIRTPLVLDHVLSQSEVAKVPELRSAEDPLKWLAGNIRVDSVGQSSLFKISLACADSTNSTTIVNAVANQYLLLLGQEEDEHSREVISGLTEEKSIRETRVKQRQDELRQLTRLVTGEDPYSQNPTVNPILDYPLANLSNRLIAMEVEESLASARIRTLEAQLAKRQAMTPADLEAGESSLSLEQPGLVDQVIERDAEVLRLRERISTNQKKLEDLELSLLPEKAKDYHGCLVLKDAIAEDEKLLLERCAVVRERTTASLAASRVGQFSSRTLELEEELAAMKSELEGNETTKQLLLDRFQEKLAEAEAISDDALELLFKRRELTKEKEVLDVLSERIMRLTTEQRAPDQVKLLQLARKQLVPTMKYPYTGMGLASLLFFVPFGLAGAREYLLRRVSDLQQLEDSTSVQVIGEVARLPVQAKGARNGSKARMDRGLTVFEESIDGLRTHLMLSEELMGMKVLAVASAAENEGKTSVAAQLAVNLAWVSGKRTLLIDGDLRSPDIHNVFDIPLEPGLVEILTKECSAEDAIVRNEKNYTDVLPAGKLHTNPHRLLGNGVMKSLMEEVRAKYDHIIIDTPPILAASEALVLARMADKSFMCAMKDSSRIDQIKRAHERLIVAGGQPIGLVLNGVPTGQYMHRYGAYAYARD